MSVCQSGEHGLEFCRVLGSVVGWNTHADQQNLGIGGLRQRDDAGQMAFRLIQRQTTQSVIRAQFDGDDVGRMRADCLLDACAATCRGFPADTCIDHFPVPGFRLGLELLIEQCGPALFAAQTVGRRQRVAQNQDSAGFLGLQSGNAAPNAEDQKPKQRVDEMVKATARCCIGHNRPRKAERMDGMVATSMQTILRAKALTRRVTLGAGELTILDDVSFAINAGESVAIVGASGSGKSTLLSLLAGLDLPSEGDVELAGESLSSLDEDGRARLRGRHVGFVFQSFQLLPSLTALENVMLPLELSGGADAQRAAKYVLVQVGLADRLNSYPRQLSGGEQQRVALARAFVTRPKVLFADEPTGNLDTRTGSAIIDLLFDLNAQSGTTLILVTHDPGLAARCGRTLRIDAGRLLA